MLHTAMTRVDFEKFCIDFLNGCNSYLLPKIYEDELEELSLHLTAENIDQSLDCIFKELFFDGANLGRLVAALGFIKKLCNRYTWCNMDELIEILLNVLKTIHSNHL